MTAVALDLVGPFGDAALALHRRGWHPIPLPSGRKSPPPDDVTGWKAPPVTVEMIEAWSASSAGGNVAVRMPDGVIGIDVDDYGDKHGATDLAALEELHGRLPPTFTSTSREGTRSSIRFYKVPVGTRFPPALSSAIEIIQPHHRYAVVAPSMHPQGRRYSWYDLVGEESWAPDVDDIVDLPWSWIEAFKITTPVGAGADPATTEAVAVFITANMTGARIGALKGIRTSLEARRRGRHDSLVERACQVARESAAGWYAAAAGFDVLHRWWVEVMDDERRLNGTEFADAVAWGIGQAAADPSRVAEMHAAAVPPPPIRLPANVDPTTGELYDQLGDVVDEVGVAFDGFRLTDAGNAARLLALSGGRLRYVHAWGRWIVYQRGRWAIDANDALVTERAKKVAVALLAHAVKLPMSDERQDLFKWAMRSESSASLASMVRLARGMAEALTDHADLDADPYLLNVRNGTVDLRTGALRAHDPGDLLTMQVAVRYDPAATAPLWTACLQRWQPNPEIRSYLQRELGAGTTGHPTETLSIHHGGGGNGKGKFFGTIEFVLGEYCAVPHKSLLVAQRHEQHETIKADLFRKRLAITNETKAADVLDDEAVKSITGGDRMRARRMREDPWYFWPTHTMVVTTNFRPAIQGRDESIWRRVRLIDWSVTIPPAERDIHLATKLRAEAPGILRWLIEGACRFIAEGFDPPPSILASTARYRIDENTPARFVAECLTVGKGWVMSIGLQQELDRWCRDQSLPAVVLRDVTPLLQAAGCHTERRTIDGKKCTIWVRVCLSDNSAFNGSDQA